MRRSLPVVYSTVSRQSATLYAWAGEGGLEPVKIVVDSEAWFDWLASEQSFRCTCGQGAGQTVNFTVRPEKRGQRTYWQGWKTIQGRTSKKYIGATAKMSKSKLDAVGGWFYDQLQVSCADPEMQLYAAVVDLTWLVEQLLVHCQQPALVTQAQQELERIRRSFGNRFNYQNCPEHRKGADNERPASSDLCPGFE